MQTRVLTEMEIDRYDANFKGGKIYEIGCVMYVLNDILTHTDTYWIKMNRFMASYA